jgi:hypothetical protein
MSLISNKDEFLYVEKYRPAKIDDCILPERLKKTLMDIVKQGEIPNMLFAGGAGCGKCLDPNEKISLMVSDEIYEILKLLPVTR